MTPPPAPAAPLPVPDGRTSARAAAGATAPIRTTCPYCGVGCGVLALPDGKGSASIMGDPEHPANAGRLCSKGSALAETLGRETRLLDPTVDGARVSWAHALDQVAQRIEAIRVTHGPKAIAFYLSGQLLTEDYYVANKLAKGFIGTPHVDTNSRLCMASSVAGHRRAFGADVVPQCYEDLELADLVVLAGSNAAWCHPILYQRMQTARGERGVRIVNIDPRRTATSEGIDLQLALKPGSDGTLWSGLLVWLAEHRAIDT
jgi:assimilatory nitrate reductase catalytic subunit